MKTGITDRILSLAKQGEILRCFINNKLPNIRKRLRDKKIALTSIQMVLLKMAMQYTVLILDCHINHSLGRMVPVVYIQTLPQTMRLCVSIS